MILSTINISLQTQTTAQCEQWYVFLRERCVAFPDDPRWMNAAYRVFMGSEFAARILMRDPELFADLLQSEVLTKEYAVGDIEQQLQQHLVAIRDESQLHIALRRFRRQQMLRIVWRDLAGWANLETTLEDLSALADACIMQTLALLHAWQVRDLGTPEDAERRPQQLIILSMGKLGARELNLSSDIDLIFIFPAHGPVRASNGNLSRINSEQFFQRLAQKLIQALSHISADGFVFRVDARLRPFGDAGPLVISIPAMEDYYHTQARDWERYAMVKARPLTGDPANVQQLMGILRPFVYRRYLDFAAIDSLRELKRLIVREVTRKGLEHNIKLGPGGIREIEFIGQVFQIIRGGRNPELQIRPILKVLELLDSKGILPSTVITELQSAYKFLRLVENRLQAWRDQQIHALPDDPTERMRLAYSMNFDDWDSFFSALNIHRQKVQQHFDTVFAVSKNENAAGLINDGLINKDNSLDNPYKEIWRGDLDASQSEALLIAAGYTSATAALQRLYLFRDSPTCRALGTRGRVLLDQLVPKILESIAHKPTVDVLLERLLRLVETIARRTAYVALLLENNIALTQLIQLAANSPWIIEKLIRHPLLLDELLDPRRLYAPQRHKELLLERDTLLKNIPKDDQEQQMERLRLFTHSNMLRIAAADLTGVIPLMVVSDYLTDLAEVTLSTALEQCWEYLTARHGRPSGLKNHATGFAIIGYGKLGGIELGYGSDLDLVFLHDNCDQDGQTDGVKPLANDVFYGRLAQRLIHILNTRTPSGILYEVDTRLRPNGKAGLLVSSIDAFSHYQASAAWTWEHQALLRARPIAGDPAIRNKFRATRIEVLTKKRDLKALRTDIQEMREKMRGQLDQSKQDLFDIKQGRGGITDIEFIVQYHVLYWAAEYPDLLDWTDNIRWLEKLANHALLTCEQTRMLADSYRALRGAAHRLTLQHGSGLIQNGQLQEERQQVQSAWQQIFHTE